MDGGTVRKGGIRRTRDKKGDWLPEGFWADGDLLEMQYLLTKIKGVRNEDIVKYNYQEHDETEYKCANGKIDVLKEISKLFNRDDKTFFVLYYTGHGCKDDGSWVFPVERSISVCERPQHSQPETDSNPPPDSRSTEPEPASGDSPTGNQITVHVDVHIESGATGGASYNEVEERKEVDRYESFAESNGLSHSTSEPIPKVKETVENTDTIEDGSIVSQYAHLESDLHTKRLNDFVTFEDVIGLWDEKKNERNRYLMIILDCCYAGKWVENMNRENRRDICIQAACRSIEICKVAKDQLTSVFTKAFVSAQCLSLGKKVALSFLDHAFVLNFVSIARSDKFTPLSSKYAPFGNIKFFDSFDDMYLKTSS